MEGEAAAVRWQEGAHGRCTGNRSPAPRPAVPSTGLYSRAAAITITAMEMLDGSRIFLGSLTHHDDDGHDEGHREREEIDDNAGEFQVVAGELVCCVDPNESRAILERREHGQSPEIEVGCRSLV